MRRHHSFIEGSKLVCEILGGIKDPVQLLSVPNLHPTHQHSSTTQTFTTTTQPQQPTPIFKMVSITFKTLSGAAAVYMLSQQVQCPPIAIPLITSAALQTAAAVGSAGASFAGAIIGANVGGKKRSVLNRRQEFVAPPGVPQFEFDRCYNDLSQESVSINAQGPVQNNGIQIDGLPATCMNLATVITGDANGPPPTPCGSACLLYNSLSPEDYEELRVTFEGLKNA